MARSMSLRRKLILTSAVAAALFSVEGARPAMGSGTFYWDPGPVHANTNMGSGPGSWDLTTTNWTDGGFGDPDVKWNNDGLTTAIFNAVDGSPPDSVSVDSAISAAGLTLNVAGYNFTGNGSLSAGAITQTNAGVGTGTNTIATQLSGAAAINVTQGTLVLSNGNNTLNGSVSIGTGATIDVMAPTTHSIGTVSLNGGTLLVRGGSTTTNGTLFDNLYGIAQNGNPNQNLNLDANGNVVLASIAPTKTRFPTSAITYDTTRIGVAGNDGQNGNNGQYGTVAMGAFLGQNQDNIESLTTGTLKVTTAGTYTFGTRSDDGSVIYIDSNGDGKFQAGEEIVNNNRDQGYANATGNVTLAAGSYKIAIGYYQGGCCDNNGLEVRYGVGASLNYDDPGMSVLDPNNPVAGTSFSYTVFNPADLSGSSINVTNNSVIDLEALVGAVGNVTISPGVTLTTQGLAGGTVTLGTLTGTGSATLSTSLPTVAGALSGFTLFTKSGTSSLTLNADAPSFSAPIVVTAGTLIAASTQALGSATFSGNTTVQSGAQLSLAANNIAEPVTISGTGTATNGALESDTSSRTFTGPVTLAADSFIVSSTAGTALTMTGGVTNGGFQTRFGGAGDFNINTTGITGTGGLLKTEGGALNINVDSSYSGVTETDAGTLNLGAALTGSPTINVVGGTFNVNSGGNVKVATAINVTGGTANINSGGTAQAATSIAVSGGTFNLNAGGTAPAATALNVSGTGTFNGNTAIAPAATVTVTGGTFNSNAAGAVGTTNNVSGGIFRVTAPNVGSGVINVTASGRLQFDAGAGNTASITTPSSNINVDSGGTVHAKSGIGDLSTQNIVIHPVALTSGLFETELSGSFNEAPFTPSQTVVAGTPRAESTSNALFPDNTTFAYSGKIVVPNNNGNGTGTVAFGENFDDNVLVKVDGVQVLRDTNWNVVTQATLTLSAGLHDVEFRFGQGGGGVGPVEDDTNHWGPGAGNNGLGFGVYIPASSPTNPGLNGTNYVDPALTNAFFAPTGGGTVQVDPTAELRARTITGATTINLGGTLTLTAGTVASPLSSDTGTLNVLNSSQANVGANHTLKVQTLNLSSGVLSTSAFTKTGAGTVVVSATPNITLNNNSIVANAGLMDLSSTMITGTAQTTQLGLQGRLYVNTQIDPRSAAGVAGILGTSPTNINILTSANAPHAGLDFQADNDLGTFFNNTAVNNPGTNANFTVGFFGTFTAQVSGTHTFGIAENDDNAAIFVDLNRDGVFEDNEQVIGKGCCNGVGANTTGTASLTAGQTYAIAILNEDTGGGASIGATVQEPTGGTVTAAGTIIDPGASGQTTQFNYTTGGGFIEVDNGGILAVGGTTGPITATLSGTLRYAAQATPSNSTLANVVIPLSQNAVIETQTNQNVAITTSMSLIGNLTKTGAGRLAINVPATGTGSVTVNGGVLSGSGSFSGPLNIASGGTVNAGATAGTIGTLSTGNLTASAGGTLSADLDPAASGLKADLINVTGTADVTGSTLSITLLSAPTLGQTFTIVQNDLFDSTVGKFAQGNSVTAVFSSQTYAFNITYNVDGGDGFPNDIVLTNVAVPTPEPATFSMLALAGVGLLARRRRR